MATNETASPFVGSFRYYYYDLWEEAGDRRVSEFPFMTGGPWPILMVVGFYAYFVKILGPRMMKSRAAFSLKPLLFVYSAILSIFNGWVFVSIIFYSKFGILNTWKVSFIVFGIVYLHLLIL